MFRLWKLKYLAHQRLIKLIGGYNAADMLQEYWDGWYAAKKRDEDELKQVREHYEKRLAICIQERDKARQDYSRATTRIREQLEADVFGYAKRDRILRRRDDLMHAMWSAMRKEAFDWFDRWTEEDLGG